MLLRALDLESEAMKKRKPKTEPRNIVQLLDELSGLVEREASGEIKRESAIFVLGYAMGLALRSGWTLEALKNLRAWPK